MLGDLEAAGLRFVGHSEGRMAIARMNYQTQTESHLHSADASHARGCRLRCDDARDQEAEEVIRLSRGGAFVVVAEGVADGRTLATLVRLRLQLIQIGEERWQCETTAVAGLDSGEWVALTSALKTVYFRQMAFAVEITAEHRESCAKSRAVSPRAELHEDSQELERDLAGGRLPAACW
jgi:hypothetical protein